MGRPKKVSLDGVGAAGGEAPGKTLPPILCRRIRSFREAKGLDQKALAARLGVTGNAVSNWECGRGRPDVNLIPAICRTLGVTLYELYGEAPPADTLQPRERTLLDDYRALSPGGQYTLEKTLETLTAVQRIESREIRRLLYFSRPLAAGTADPTEFEQEAEAFYLYASADVDRADYVFKTGGDSMEPRFHSGDLVLVQRLKGGDSLRCGEIGAFSVGNEIYIKQYEKDGLHSLNKKYDVLRFAGDQRVFLIGRVLRIIRQEERPSDAELAAFLGLHGAERA
ncbi:MAG: helix-turn-helix domain-containing protein [Oscillospiraceae bacterium]|nr:helix-turn-helix domain-containing protein [Oscillospiraceae bacterium]